MSKRIGRDIVVAWVLGATLNVVAIPPLSAQGTAAQRVACTGDAFGLCSSDIPNVERITACLRRNRERISAACRQAMGTVSADLRNERSPQ